MTRILNLRADPSDPPPEAHTSVASWYTQGASDGLGDRLLMCDNTGAASFELLRFRRDLARTPGFEDALRARVAALSAFHHSAFPAIRAVEQLENGSGLALVSLYTPGKRLSEMFHGPRRAGLHPAFGAWLIRQLTPALADLHGHGEGIFHGALAADRVVLTPDGELMIVDYALGAALGRLGWSAARLWADLGIMVPEDERGRSRLDGRTDVTQLALIALSVMLGRRITPLEYPNQLSRLLDEFAEVAERRSPALAAPLRAWLERALSIDNRAFETPLDAMTGVLELPGPLVPLPFGQSGPPQPARPEARHEVGRQTATALLLNPGDERNIMAVQPTESGREATPPLQPGRDLSLRASAWSRAHDPMASVGGSRGGVDKRRRLIIALAALAAVEALAIAALFMTRPAPLPVAVPLTIESAGGGDAVVVDGRQMGVTPIELRVDAGTRSIRVIAREAPRPVETTGTTALAAQEGSSLLVEGRPPSASSADKARAEAKARADAAAAAAIAQAASRQRSGGIRFSSPIELKVLEGDRVLGSTADGPIVAAAGTHELDLINTTFGYKARQTVTIRAGQITSLSVTPPNGRVSINALPWAQVWIDGAQVGETPLANLSVPVGEHEIVFRHPQLGERREKAVIRSGVLTRISTTFGQ
jgi:serine/threonine-protein kinase